jgi:hypothetical protein
MSGELKATSKSIAAIIGPTLIAMSASAANTETATLLLGAVRCGDCETFSVKV